MKTFLIDTTITVRANDLENANKKADEIKWHLNAEPLVAAVSVNMVEEIPADVEDSRTLPMPKLGVRQRVILGDDACACPRCEAA